MVKKATPAPSKDAELVSLIPSDTKALSKLIATIAKVAEDNRSRISFAAPACVEHAIQHGNVTLLTELYKALGPDSRRNQAFVKWCMFFAPVRWIEGKNEGGVKALGSFGIDKGRVDEFKAKLSADRVAFLAALIKLPYWEFEPEPKVKPFSLIEMIEAQIKRAKTRRDSDDAEKKTDEDDFFGIEEAEVFLASLKAKKVAPSVTMH